jgi:hypothetical protein
MDYSEKYLKYKNKYITLKNSFSNQLGGAAAAESSQPISEIESKSELDTILNKYIGKPVYVCGKNEKYELFIIKPDPRDNKATLLYSASQNFLGKPKQSFHTYRNKFYILCGYNLCIELGDNSMGDNHFIFLNVESDDWFKLLKNENVMNAIFTKKPPLRF